MKVPLIQEVLHVPQHFALSIDPLFDGAHILRSQDIVDHHQVIVYPCDEVVIVPENVAILSLLEGSGGNAECLPDALYFGDHLDQFCLFFCLNGYLYKIILVFLKL